MSSPQIIHTTTGEELVVLPRAEYEALLARGNEAIEAAVDAFVDVDAIHETEFAASDADVLPKEVTAAILRGDSRLKAIRRWKEVTQLQLSQQTGISQGYLSDLENGHRAGTPETIAKLAEVLDVPLAWLSWPEPTNYLPTTHKKAQQEAHAALQPTPARLPHALQFVSVFRPAE